MMATKPMATGTYLALVRGLNNIGTARRVHMADLRGLFEDLGFRQVRTLLNSGNVVFSARGHRREQVLARIESELASRFKLTSQVILLSGQEVTAAVRNNPFTDLATNPSNLLVLVPRVRSDLGRLRSLAPKPWAPEALALGRRVAYLWCANGVAKSPLWAASDRVLGRSGTVRNIATFTKALALLKGLPS